MSASGVSAVTSAISRSAVAVSSPRSMENEVIECIVLQAWISDNQRLSPTPGFGKSRYMARSRPVETQVEGLALLTLLKTLQTTAPCIYRSSYRPNSYSATVCETLSVADTTAHHRSAADSGSISTRRVVTIAKGSRRARSNTCSDAGANGPPGTSQGPEQGRTLDDGVTRLASILAMSGSMI